VLLSNNFVRYQLIKSQPDLSSQEEEQAFVRFSFSEVYGEEAKNWVLRWGTGLQIAPQVASAIDYALNDHIEKTLSAVGVKLTSMQPYLMTSFNHVRKFIGTQPYWFVLVEPNSACIAYVQAGDWKILNTSRLGADWAAELPRVMGREFQMAGLENEGSNMLLCLPGYIDHKRLAPENHAMRVLTMTPEMLIQGVVQPVASMEVRK
jgi:hypothetical protein